MNFFDLDPELTRLGRVLAETIAEIQVRTAAQGIQITEADVLAQACAAVIDVQRSRAAAKTKH